MARRVLGIAATSFVLILTAAAPAARADTTADRQGVIVSERYSPANGGNPQLVAVRPADGHVTVLTSGHRDVAPDVSPDGRSIAFERCPHARNCDQIGTVNIWIMRADGGRAHPLTACDGSRCLGSFDPAFSPDGRSIAFAQDRLNKNGVNFNGIFIMRADGSHLRRLTSNGPNDPPSGAPSFSPDGKRVVFAQETPGGENRLMMVGVDGTGLRRLLPGLDASAPSWSPNGQRVAFTLARHSGDTTSFNIATVRPSGRHLRLLTREPRNVRNALTPDYSPRGQRIVFSETSATGCRLVIISDTGQHRRTLTTGAGCYFNPSWGVNGNHAP